jgi:hypothetical protein
MIKDSFKDNMAWEKLKNYKFRHLLDMGRHKQYRQLKSVAEWTYEFEEAGFKIEEIIPSINDALVHMIEFHDLREISPVTAVLSRKLGEADLTEVKQLWIDYYYYLFTKMHQENYFLATESDSNYSVFNLRK